MSSKIGHFEILSELAKSATSEVYKANDSQSGQTVALKAIQLSAFGDQAPALLQSLAEETETAKALGHSNLAPLYGTGEIEGQFCASMEYIQGNSVATMVARKEGFSIWDLLDVGRQVCSGLDHAHSHRIFHYSMEPAKIMCGWDGTVKILGFGISSAGKFAAQTPGAILPPLHYMSPEQVRGEAIDSRSNLFSLGAMFYEMVTDRKAFDREDVESLQQSILECTPVPPMHLNPKLHPMLSDLILKALSKDPEQRYQSGRELLDDLEKCKESKPLAAKAPAAAPKSAAVNPQASAAAQAKLAAQPSARPAPAKPPSAVSVPKRSPEPKPAVATPVQQKPAVPKAPSPAAVKSQPVAQAPKAAAAAAGWSGEAASSAAATPQLDSSNQFISSCVKATIDSESQEEATMSSAVDELEIEIPETSAPKINVDPLMAEGGPAQGAGISFSEMTELPPLKEVYVEPPPPPPVLEPPRPAKGATVFQGGAREEEEKPKIQPRVVAQKAIKEIKGVPPRLVMYSVGGAVALILLIVAGLFIHIHNLNTADEPSDSATSQASQPAAQSTPQAAAPVASAASPAAAQPAAPAEEEESARGTTRAARHRNAHRKVAAAAPAIVPGQMLVDSTPQGAKVQVDGKTDPSWVTPFTLTGLDPGQHTVTVSKAGFSSDTRSVTVTSGSKSFVISHLAQLMATLAVSSTPAGANVYVDGRNSGKTTPAQVSVDKGNHVILVRKSGYLDETTSAQFVLGQTVNFSPALRPLGNVDDIKTVGRMKRLFGGGGEQGMGTVSVRTQPKGAQIAVNQHMLEKNSPVEFVLDPGNYIVDITLSGYAPVHKVISVDKGGKVVVDETLQRQ
ncbi:MAG TPA: serine/threonine-protein kinase [Candidatus Aquilonibacter sp.]|nr:serine/threonine-protein kinase [Candidatus Aquilonibacter sp.]